MKRVISFIEAEKLDEDIQLDVIKKLRDLPNIISCDVVNCEESKIVFNMKLPEKWFSVAMEKRQSLAICPYHIEYIRDALNHIFPGKE